MEALFLVPDGTPAAEYYTKNAPSGITAPLMQDDATVIGGNNQNNKEEKPKKSKKIWLWLVLALVGFFVLLLVLGIFAGDKESEEFIDSAEVDSSVVDSSLVTVEPLDLDIVLDKPVVIEMVDQNVDIPPEYRNIYMEIDSLLIKTAGKCAVTIVSYCNVSESDTANSNLSRVRAEKFKERLVAAGVDSSIITLKKYAKFNKNQLVVTVGKVMNNTRNVNRTTPTRVTTPNRTNTNRNEVGSKTTNPNRRTTPTRPARSINGESGR